MSILDRLVSIIAPHTCLGCGYEGAIICIQCFSNFDKIPPRCHKCQRMTNGAYTCDSCLTVSHLARVLVPVKYEGLAKQMVWRLKFDGAQAAAATMAALMLPLIDQEADTWLVPVPTAGARARSRGYDQAKLLAKALGRRSRLRYTDCLRRHGRTHQVGSSRQQRLRQLEGAFTVKGRSLPVAKKVILVDDVITTGATLEAAAGVLKQAGIEEVSAVVFAQA